MKKVILQDRSFLIIEDDKLDALSKKLEGTAKFKLNHLNGVDILDPKEVRRVTNAVAGQDYTPKTISTSHRISSRNDISDEQREKNLEKIAKIKADLLNKKLKRENNEQA